mmetsp:Transcript_8678/g.13090  ORF Transcript_8678/g.13090 Transcript_8678/m.13090 type:complete len:83 (-) Transcript_8678:324-572(-)
MERPEAQGECSKSLELFKKASRFSRRVSDNASSLFLLRLCTQSTCSGFLKNGIGIGAGTWRHLAVEGSQPQVLQWAACLRLH